MRVVVEALAEEFDVLDVAAAAVKLAHTATARDGEEQEFDQKEKRPTSRAHITARLFIGAGKRTGIRPADLVGAIAGETGVPGNMLGPIKISDTFSLVDVPEEFAEEIIDRMSTANLRGKQVTIRRDREAARA